MTNKEKLTNWLRENHPELSWSRTGGDGPQKRDDANYINRKEGYEIRDLIYSYYTRCSLGFIDENFKKTYGKIMNYKKANLKTRLAEITLILLGPVLLLLYLLNAMKKDFSWKEVLNEYEDLYLRKI